MLYIEAHLLLASSELCAESKGMTGKDLDHMQTCHVHGFQIYLAMLFMTFVLNRVALSCEGVGKSDNC